MVDARFWIRHGILLLAAVTLSAILAVVVRWVLVAGPQGAFDALARLARHGTTTIDDFRVYPGRRLAASTSPRPFAGATDSWQAPAQLDAGTAGLQDLDAVLTASRTTAFLVVQDDRIRLERYWDDGAAWSPSQFFSTSKSVMSVIVGAAIQDGLLASVDQRLVELVPDLAGRGLGDVTIEHLLTMTSGLHYTENDNPFELHVPFNYTSDIERMMLRFRLRHAPGTVYEYKSGDTSLLALALSRALSPRTITAWVQERLWSPLGMEDDGIWSLDREGGLEKAWCCLAGTARDLAKIGRLYLAGGSVNGRQIVPAAWVERSVGVEAVGGPLWSDTFRDAGFRGYGYSWWLLSREDGDYLAQGKDGQFLYVNPARRAIVVRLGRGAGPLRSSQWAALFRSLSAAASASE